VLKHSNKAPGIVLIAGFTAAKISMSGLAEFSVSQNATSSAKHAQIV
jgi:hypothetical protein